MKRLFISLSLLLALTTSFAQSDKYLKGMEKNLVLLDSAKTTEDFTTVAAAFERIADAEKTQWLPYYYASLAHIRKGFVDKNVNKDDVAYKAEALISKAEALEPKNADLHLLKNMAATLHMLVDPQSRFMQYGQKMSEPLAIAKQIDPNNPRVFLMEGQSVLGTPAAFGGGKDKAKPLFEKAIALYEKEKPASPIHPKWGKQTAEALLARSK
jgi:hypothetical protein